MKTVDGRAKEKCLQTASGKVNNKLSNQHGEHSVCSKMYNFKQK